MFVQFAYLFINGSATAKARGDKVKNAYWLLALFSKFISLSQWMPVDLLS